jgi:hypothetical protein
MIRKTILHDIAFRLKKIRETLGVSLDWLILDKGPMFYKEKDYNNTLAALPPEIQELVTEMEQVPVLKYEILLNFHAIIGRTQEAGDQWVDKAGRYFLQ